MPETLKSRLKNGDVVLGPFVNLASGALLEIAAYAGFDFVILDTEHGPLDIPTTEDLCRTAAGVGITPIVRVRENDPAQILRALDIGASGVQVPQICTKADAEALIRAAKYAPLGMRGVSPYTRAARYFSDGPKIFERLNEEQMVLIHLEGVEGLENLDEIIAVPGLDVIFLGPYDLSQSLGIPGQISDPRVVDRMRQAAEKINAAGLTVGTFADGPEAARRWIDAGVRYISLSVDTGIYLQGCRTMIQAVRGK
ncbi:MAG: aldolase/citrate lyase family protein [bacterium]|nr:aldolase/citrate lyase family protein [bacterium]